MKLPFSASRQLCTAFSPFYVSIPSKRVPRRPSATQNLSPHRTAKWSKNPSSASARLYVSPAAPSFVPQVAGQPSSMPNNQNKDDEDEGEGEQGAGNGGRGGSGSGGKDDNKGKGGEGGEGTGGRFAKMGSGRNAALETAFATLVGVTFLALGGAAYHEWVLYKMSLAFAPGYEPVLELEAASHPSSSGRSKNNLGVVTSFKEEGEEDGERVRRREQDLIDRIVWGLERGHYWLIWGPKGVGKTSMIVDSMLRNNAEGVAICEAHADPEIFRLRLGYSLNFEYAEDYIGGLFSRRDPREGGALADIERAMNKLESVAIQYRMKKGRPPVLILNNIHFVHDDDEGHRLLHLMQQRAEAWAQAGVCTVIFNTDDQWIYDSLKRRGARLAVLPVCDLSKGEAFTAIKQARKSLWNEDVSDDKAEEIWNLLGGRLAHIGSVVKRPDMAQAVNDMFESERAWLLSKVGLIPDHDDDVMDEQKYCSSSFLLFQELVRIGKERVENGLLDDEPTGPSVEFWRAREVMTRTDFIQPLDHDNIININHKHLVSADSRLLYNVMKSIVEEDEFQGKLDNVRARIDEIESLHRTAELTVKDGKDSEGFLRIQVGRG